MTTKLVAAISRFLHAFHHENGHHFGGGRRASASWQLMDFDGDLGSLEALPIEIQYYIMSFFSVRELAPLFCVSRKMNFLASSNFLWHPFLQDEHVELPEYNAGDAAFSYKELYRLHSTTFRWSARVDAKASSIDVSENGRTAFRALQTGTNPAVLATLPFRKGRDAYEVRVNTRGSWIGIGLADRNYRIVDGSTLGKQRNCFNAAFFCQDTTVLQMEGARRAHVEKSVSHRIETGDVIRVKVDFSGNSISFFRNGALVGSLKSERPLSEVELFPCVNLSQGTSLTLSSPSTAATLEYIAKYGALPPVH